MKSDYFIHSKICFDSQINETQHLGRDGRKIKQADILPMRQAANVVNQVRLAWSILEFISEMERSVGETGGGGAHYTDLSIGTAERIENVLSSRQ